jgi:phosphoribosylanthranilate isomerase
VVRAKTPADLNKFSDEFRFVDAFVEEFGGMGKRLNLKWFENRDNSKIILAGGLTAENLSELQGFGFFGVDVSSGVEEKKGKKSKKKVIDFVENALKL